MNHRKSGILIVTQVLDRQHPILGFFHRWVLEFASHYEHVTVLALQVGEYELPSHVNVLSLGKNEGKGRLIYLWRFYATLWRERANYCDVFVHMNQLYIPLGYPLWRILGKRIGLWYAHGAVSRSLTVAVMLADIIFTSTPEGLQIDTPKRRLVGQGIDMDLFKEHSLQTDQSPLVIMTDGRISPAKNVHILVVACHILVKKGYKIRFKIVGTALTQAEKEYEAKIKRECTERGLDDVVEWVGGVSQTELALIHAQSALYIHAGATKSLDKALVQAVASGIPTFSSNDAFVTIVSAKVPTLCYEHNNVDQLVERIETFLGLSRAEQEASIRPLVAEFRRAYSIERLISDIVSEF